MRATIDALTAERRVVVEASVTGRSPAGQSWSYAKEQHSRELKLAAHLDRLWQARSTLPLRAFAEDPRLHDDQRAAVNLALTSTVSRPDRRSGLRQEPHGEGHRGHRAGDGRHGDPDRADRQGGQAPVGAHRPARDDRPPDARPASPTRRTARCSSRSPAQAT